MIIKFEKKDKTLEDIGSYVGKNPTCDNCGIFIRIGDDVIQQFTGKVVNDEDGEPVIKTEEYHLVHRNCVSH